METVRASSGRQRDRLEAILQRVIEAYRPSKVILFGSRARGDAADTSDIDLIVVAESDKSFVGRLAESAALLPEPNLDILIYTPREFEEMLSEGRLFLKRVLEEGKVLYESSR